MKSIIDYISEYGEQEFDSLPFNEVDSLILSQISYLKFDGMVPSPQENKPGVLFASICEHELYENLYEDKRYEKNNRKLFTAVAASKRFGSVHINNFMNIIDSSWEIQFAAMTFTFPGGHMYVAFRGTDETLIGWKEDFNMALFTPVPAQEKAMQYLNIIGSKTYGHFLVGGHSKGGNLAVYSACKCQEAVRSRIDAIYNHDGPGFLRDTLTTTDEYKNLSPIIHKYMPQSSVVGMLMESREPYEIVDCRSFGILQHDPFNWIIDGCEFKKVNAVYTHVRFKDESINKWVENMSEEEAKTFVETTYSVLSATGATTLLDFMDNWGANTQAIINACANTDPETKEMLTLIFKSLFDVSFEIMKVKMKDHIQPGFEKFQEHVSKWQENDFWAKIKQ